MTFVTLPPDPHTMVQLDWPEKASILAFKGVETLTVGDSTTSFIKKVDPRRETDAEAVEDVALSRTRSPAPSGLKWPRLIFDPGQD